MTNDDLIILYISARVQYSMDDDDVDYALMIEGLDVNTCDPSEAWQAVKKHAPAAAGARSLKRMMRRLERNE